jgi:Flp pilus assembly protein TadG
VGSGTCPAATTRRWPSAGQDDRDERGAISVEAAFVLPVLFFLLFAVLDWGFTFHDRLAVSNMSQSGARTGSSQSDDPLADYSIVQAVRTNSGGQSAREVTAIVIFKATGTCNRYTGADMARASTDFGCVGAGSTVKIDNSWCPTTRKTALSGTAGPPDYVGVYVSVLHPSLTGVLGAPKKLSTSTIIRIEPRTAL